MKEYQSLSHTKWDCKYHVVFIPKKCKKRILGRYGGTLARCFMSWRRSESRRSLRGT